MNNFKRLKLIDPLVKAVKEKGYENPTPIQEQAIPTVLDGRDLLGIAQTGTGKTAAFAMPIIQHLYVNGHTQKDSRFPRALILTPTRELAIQIGDSIKSYNSYTKISYTVVYGGVKIGKQIKAIKAHPQILVATPGRLLDLIGQGMLSLKHIELFVLDEADRMLDMGFIHDIRKIVDMVPKERQTLFFSATMPTNIIKLSKSILTNPVRVEVARRSSPSENVEQSIYFTNHDRKVEVLKHIIDRENIYQALVFVRTKHGADKLVRRLKKYNLRAMAIHGNKSQAQRQDALDMFKKGKVHFLIATDIVARGIDISGLMYVINFNIPNQPEDYIHRIGRSGRAGEQGHAISICEPEENIFVKDIEKHMKQSIDRIEDHPFTQTDKPMTAQEKKAFNKQKQEKKRAYFAAKKASRNNSSKKRRNPAKSR